MKYTIVSQYAHDWCARRQFTTIGVDLSNFVNSSQNECNTRHMRISTILPLRHTNSVSVIIEFELDYFSQASPFPFELNQVDVILNA